VVLKEKQGNESKNEKSFKKDWQDFFFDAVVGRFHGRMQ